MKAKKKKLIYNSVTFGLVIAAFLICQLLLSTGGMSRSFRGQLIPICCWIVMAVSLNLVVGISGELSLGHAGFMSIGAFTGIIVSGWMQRAFQMEDPVLRLVLAMVIGAVLAGIAGALIGIPVLRLKGDYLAIVTLAFGEIIRNLIDCLYVSVDGQSLRFGFLNNKLPGDLLMNGPNGAVSVQTIATFTAGFVLVIIALIIVLNLTNSRSGRAIQAIRDARIAYGVAGPIPTRAPSAEAAARGCETTRETVDAFAQAVLEDIHPRDSWRAAKAFREHIAVEMAKRALTKSVELGGGAVRE